jgi:hypothetical protein
MDGRFRSVLSVRLLAGVFLVALAGLLFEVTLTRIFSVTLWYHFGFLAIALAMLGGTAAAVACFVFRERLAGERAESNLGWFALLFAVAAPLAVACHLSNRLERYDVDEAKLWLYASLQCALLFAVFFAAGMCISIALVRHAARLGKVYFADLVGAALGTVLVAPLLWTLSAPTIAFVVSAAGAVAALLFFPAGRRGGKLLAAGATLAAAALVCVNDPWGLVKVSRIKSYAAAQLQTIEPEKVYEQWSLVGRVAVFPPRKSRGGREMMRVTVDGGAPTNLHRYGGDPNELGYLRHDFRQIGQHLRPGGEILIIGSAGGRDVRAALEFGQKRITAVELNPVTAHLVMERYADYIGHIFSDPRVRFYNAEGRNFVASSSDRYDLIQINMVDSWGGGAYVFNESNLYTREAIADYLAHLKPGGILAITRYYRFDETLRLANTMLEELEASGTGDGHQRIAVVLEKRTAERACVLLKNGTFTAEETERLASAAWGSGHEIVYAPFVSAERLVQSDYARLFRSLIDPVAHGERGRADVVGRYRRDVSAVTDDRPFFFFMDRPGQVLQFGEDRHSSRRLAVPLLYGVVVFLAAASVLTVLVPLVLSRRANVRGVPFKVRCMLYFGCLGLGFMLIELGLVHKFTVLLGYPGYAFVVVLATLLCAGGLGSVASERWLSRGTRPLYILLPLVAQCAGALAFAPQLEMLRIVTPAWATACVVALLAPLGFLMGMCLPAGMQIARRLHGALVAWGWGVNGVCSVLGCAAALALALHFGLTVCLLAGGGCYLLALLAISTVKPASIAQSVRSAGGLQETDASNDRDVESTAPPHVSSDVAAMAEDDVEALV